MTDKEAFEKFWRELKDANLRYLLSGRPEEHPLCGRIPSALPKKHLCWGVFLAGKEFGLAQAKGEEPCP